MDKTTFQELFSRFDTALASVDAKKTEGAAAGVIRSVKDGILHIYGLDGVHMGEVVQVEGSGAEALVMQLDRRNSYAILLSSGAEVKEGQAVTAGGKFLGLFADEKILGRVVDALGTPIDGGAPLKGGEFMLLERIAPGVMTREPVSEPLETGILAIDSMIPVGRGQRELIIGDRQTGKTTVALDAILNQKGKDVVCIYVAVGQREAKTANVVRVLQERGAMDYTVVVSAGASSPAVMQYLAPYAGAAIGEYFMNKGKHALIVYDDLSKHAVAYREMSLLLRRPPGREAYPGDVFYLHSRLLERAAKLSKENGGGSLTALPIIETQANDVSAYIPTNVISITDGQIFLETDLFNRGIRPAINIGISVSRVGGAAQTKVMKKASGSAKLDLAQFYELAAFTQFSSELDPATKQQLTRGERVVEAMKQKQNAPYKLWQEVVLLFAATKGYLDNVPAKDVVATLTSLLSRIEASRPELVTLIETKREMSEEVQKGLEEAVSALVQV
ncbi:F0F1 ATP synthase subunit alpha [Patescibacteria group bacterium]|nr:F0F1 ATP synthase subunit alpha [Patescibacteria group bacterium]